MASTFLLVGARLDVVAACGSELLLGRLVLPPSRRCGYPSGASHLARFVRSRIGVGFRAPKFWRST